MAAFQLARRLIWAAALVLAGAAAAQAGDCGYAYCWGAVAVGPDGAAGRSSGRRTAPDAWERADEACGGKCETIEPFANSCAAIAVDNEKRPWTGFAPSRAAAEAAALGACAESDSGVCRIRVWACSS